ncbi:MAG: M28 family peptidase, partial [Acidobacteria bacterium]|nr:M28 family peptidase [Acidobacteriota bacterium]
MPQSTGVYHGGFPTMSTRALVLTLAVCLSAAGQPNAQQAFLAPITADTLKAHVSFLASDALQGRNTPSPGLDVAAEYIASQFRRLGLQAAGNDGYFQIAPYAVVRQPMENFELTIESGGKTWKAPKDRVVASAAVAVSLNGVEVVKVLLPDENAALPAKEAVQGKAVVLVSGPTRSRAMTQKRQELLGLGPAIVVTAAFTGQAGSQLREAGAPAARRAPQVTTSDPEFTSFAEALADGARLSATIPAAVEEPVALKNVIATLPGSDPALKDSYVLLTAHYDHIGVSARGDGDRINNGANDDASGVASVLALAEAFSK